MAFPDVTTLIDDFNRADESPPTGWSGHVYSSGDGPLAVISNQLRVPSGSFKNSVHDDDFGPDLDLTFDLVNDAGDVKSFFFHVRLTNPGASNVTGYAVGLISGNRTITRIDSSSSFTNLRSSAGLPSGYTGVGDQWGCRCEGSSIELWFKPNGGSWTLEESVSDGTYLTGTRFGLEVQGTTFEIDNMRGGTLGGGAPTEVDPTAGALDLDGTTATVAVAATPSADAVVLAGTTPSAAIRITPTAGAVTLAGTTPTVGLRATPTAGALSAQGTTPTVTLRFAPSAAALAFAGTTPGVAIRAVPSAGALAGAGTAPNVVYRVAPSAGTLTFAGTTPGIGEPTTPSAGGLSFAGTTPTSALRVVPTAGALVFGGGHPSYTGEPTTVPGDVVVTDRAVTSCSVTDAAVAIVVVTDRARAVAGVSDSLAG